MSESASNLTAESSSSSDKKPGPKVIGIYGLPGTGKSTLLKDLRKELGDGDFTFFEGSEVIGGVTGGGLEAFKLASEEKKKSLREDAITSIRKECQLLGTTGIVTGHYSLWSEKSNSAIPIVTEKDLETYTHVLYLDLPSQQIVQQCHDDESRKRAELSDGQTQSWLAYERVELRKLCNQKKILFARLTPGADFLAVTTEMIRNFRSHNAKENQRLAEHKMDEVMEAYPVKPETMMVFDGDKTLVPDDTGDLFWKRFAEKSTIDVDKDPLKGIFDQQAYSYDEFRQAVFTYKDLTNETQFEEVCQHVANQVAIRPEMLDLLELVKQHEHVGAVVITCGIPRVFEIILGNAGFADVVRVVGACRLSDWKSDFVVTKKLKGQLVTHLQEEHKQYVWAFGDSTLDIDMLKVADQAVVVIGDEASRSGSVEKALGKAIDNKSLRARQMLLPNNVSPRLDTNKLPIVEPNTDFMADISRKLRFSQATGTGAADLLKASMRDPDFHGPKLRDIHSRAGWYLATHLLSEHIGLAPYKMQSVQQTTTEGHRLKGEAKTTIVALMRGGEPMAFGVNEAFPQAMFVHAFEPEDLKLAHLDGQSTLILVDSVVNSGKTIEKFVERLRKAKVNINIVVVAGVVQAEAVSPRGRLWKLAHSRELSLVALRVSENKYTGSGPTDTGNRLFNTTHMVKEDAAQF